MPGPGPIPIGPIGPIGPGPQSPRGPYNKYDYIKDKAERQEKKFINC